MRPVFLPLFCLAACAEFPQLENTVSPAARQAPYPTLTPIETVLLQAGQTTQMDAALEARIAALKERAERLRQTQIGALQ